MVVRVMPNTPALVQTGAHGLFAYPVVDDAKRELASQVLAATGLTLWVKSEDQTATALTLQTALGAAQMAITSSNTPAELRKNVTSPNGTTQAALEVFDRAQISQNIQTALAAAQKRSQELAQDLSDSAK